MYTKHTLAALLGAVATATAYQGFNYGNTFTNGAAKSQQDFEAEFRAAARLPGTDGAFTSARLYTMIQAGTTNDPISAIQAAINTRTSLLLGLWASAGEDMFNNELRALERAIEQYGDELTGLIAGISVGSEDLYRISPTGIAANSNPGANPQTIVDYVGRVRQTISGTPFASFPIGHVDTWTAFDNSSNSAVVDAVDWLGFNGFAYFEDTQDNDVSNGKALFDRAMDRTRAAARGKPIWVTETGWPVSGRTFGNGVPSPENAERFWRDVGCPLFGETNVWWYILRYAPTSPNPDFGIIGSDVNSAPRFDLSCPAVVPTTSSAAPTTSTTTRATSSATSSATTVAPPATTETEDDDDSSEPTPTPTPSSTHEDVETKTSYQPAPTTTHDGGDGGDDDTPIVPGPPPTTLSSLVSSALPTESSSGNESSAAPQPTGAVEPGSASAMSFSAAFLAMMLAVAMF